MSYVVGVPARVEREERLRPRRGGAQRYREKRINSGEGEIYVITNPAWPGYCKIGRTTNVSERLRTYQTASPHRDFQLRYSRAFGDILAADATIRQILPGFRARGEWHLLHPDDAITLIGGI